MVSQLFLAVVLYITYYCSFFTFMTTTINTSIVIAILQVNVLRWSRLSSFLHLFWKRNALGKWH